LKNINAMILLVLLPLFGASAADRADTIMRRHYDLPKPETVYAQMTMVLKDEAGRITQRQLEMYSRTTSQGTSSYTEVLAPADIRGTRFLSLPGIDNSEEQRLWLPDLGRIRKISTNSETDSFLGSDLSYWDMKTHRFELFSYSLQGERNISCIRDGLRQSVPCWLVEGIPDAGTSPYARIVSCIGKDDYFVYRSEMWAANGSPIKTVAIAEIVRRAGVIFPSQTLVVTASGHKTLLKADSLELNAGVPLDVFSLQHLSR